MSKCTRDEIRAGRRALGSIWKAWELLFFFFFLLPMRGRWSGGRQLAGLQMRDEFAATTSKTQRIGLECRQAKGSCARVGR